MNLLVAGRVIEPDPRAAMKIQVLAGMWSRIFR